jgi:hypothetical protein
MRPILLLVAVVAALGMEPQPAEARDRGFGFRQFSGHFGPKLHLRHHGLKFHHGRFVRQPQAFKSRHFGHFDHGGFAARSGHGPRLKLRHFGQGGLVLKFDHGAFVLKSGQKPRFKGHHFGRKHHHQGLFFGSGPPRQFRPRHGGFGFKDGRGLHAHR